MKRSLLIAAALSVLPLAGLGAVAAPGMHHAHPAQVQARHATTASFLQKRKDGTGLYCNEESLDCLSSDGTSGDLVYVRDNSVATSTTTVGTNTCINGQGNPTDAVQTGQGSDGAACPFLNGDGLNLLYDGREIVHFKNSAGLCFSGTSNGTSVHQKSCSAAGINFVRAGSADYYNYVNVASSNGAATSVVLCQLGGAGSTAFLQNGSFGSTCRWARLPLHP